jgi:hypothetical protein
MRRAERVRETSMSEERKEKLRECVDVGTEGSLPDFSEAKRMADRTARDSGRDPMLLAWFVEETGDHSPRVECCGEEKPAWLVYAESRGGNLTVDVNDGAYIFVYRIEKEWEDAGSV